MAVALRCFARTRGLTLLGNVKESLVGAKVNCGIGGLISVRKIVYYPEKHPKYDKVTELDPDKLPEYEVVKDPEEWKYVERLFSLKTVPPLKETSGPLPSGFIPPREEGLTHPYFIKRTRNHMMPVYLDISYRGTRQMTFIKSIEGDIWQLEKDLLEYLVPRLTKKYINSIPTKVNEFAGWIKLKGDHVSHVKKWMEIKGF